MRTIKLLLVMLCSIVISACGGGSSSTGGNGGGSSVTTTLTGVSASGNPVANGVGYALDAVSGTQYPFTTDANGNFSVNITTAAGPFLVHVTGLTSGGAQSDAYSIITKAQLGTPLNVTPLSNIVLASAAGVLPQNLETTCTSNQTACASLLTGIIANLAAANTAVANALGDVLSQFGVSPSTFDAFTSTITPGSHTGVDAVLDAIQIAPPINGSTNYQVTLANSAQTVLATVTLGGGVTAGTTPSSAALTQAQNLAAALGEIQTRITQFSNLFATSLPNTGAVTPFIDTNYLGNGDDATTIIGKLTSGEAIAIGQSFTGGTLAPYAGGAILGSTLGANVIYDVNNCATEVWVMLWGQGVLLKDTIPTANPPGTCTGGTWTIAGNQQQYAAELSLEFVKQTLSAGAAPSYVTTLGFWTKSSQTIANSNAVNPYDTVTVSSPGLVTYGHQTTPTPVVMAPDLTKPSWTQNPISDRYYNGMGAIVSCAAIASNSVPYGVGKWVLPTASTPCFNSDLVAGSDLTFKFYIGGTSGTLLETYMSRIYLTPSAASVPTSWYPTITSLNPASAASFTANVTSTLTINWTLPTGAIFLGGGVELQNISNANILPNGSFGGASNATSATVSVTPTGNAVVGGTGGTGNQFSAVHVSVTVGGITLGATNFF